MSSSMMWRRMPSPSVTPNELLEILTAHTAGYYVLPSEPYDEVYPGIFIGDSTTALCLHQLKRLGITHVLNAAMGRQRGLGLVNTSPAYYRNANIHFMGIEALDIAVFPLFEHFPVAVNFIEQALADQKGKILVHCGEGISRSSTLVLAYLMVKKGFDVRDAIRTVVKHRNILPNQGFLLQLCQLHDQLQQSTGSKSEFWNRWNASSTTTTITNDTTSPLSSRVSTLITNVDYLNPKASSGSSSSSSSIGSRSRSSSRTPTPTQNHLYYPSRPSTPSGTTGTHHHYYSTPPSRTYRCGSVDRVYTNRSNISDHGSVNKFSMPSVYKNSLLSTNLGRPLTTVSSIR